VGSALCYCAVAWILRGPAPVDLGLRCRGHRRFGMFDKNTLRRIVACSLVMFFCPFLFGQTTGTLSGTVSDNSGAVIAGASCLSAKA
jgi:hypothetical protein